MRRFALFIVCFTAIVAARRVASALASSRPRRRSGRAQAGNWKNGDCEDNGNHWGEAHVCQMRHTTFALPSGRMSVETVNGGIDIIGEDRSDVALEARVTAWAPSESEANDVLNQVVIDTNDGEVRDHGPRSHFFTPPATAWIITCMCRGIWRPKFHTMNGGIDLTRVDGSLHFETTNGGVTLDHVWPAMCRVTPSTAGSTSPSMAITGRAMGSTPIRPTAGSTCGFRSTTARTWRRAQ